ncbi:hypothetical protein POM88_051013 [Heracleum sosnowskyi]|uniref:F-box domain-containing protein n=1 Tax=Heracleum sosnowskyi TaxID=360622 RepID=A0AAD8GYS0_9APIA|nr:hypothetical protein POM88_051013 [Heracleum sosnowskyi]
MATTCYLPEEIIFIILSLLPVKSLVRFSLVCKSWQSIISSTHFIQTQRNNSEKKQPSSVLYCDYLNNVVYIDTPEDSVKLRLPSMFNDCKIKICSCNGLVCLAGFSKPFVYIWNPSTRRFKILPAPNKRSIQCDPYMGFGFDPVSSDYKILRIVMNSVMVGGSFAYVTEAELYSANNDSWKDIEIPETLKRFLPLRSSNCVYTKNGVVYVEGYDGVLSFDLKNEEFGILYQHPHNTLGKSRIFEIEGYVAMIFRVEGSDNVWMLDDVCGKLSWTKKFNLDIIHEKDYEVQCLYLGDEQYVTVNDGRYINSKNQEIKKFDPPRELTSIINYAESLVSLEGFEKQECSGKHRIMEETRVKRFARYLCCINGM